jgi:hypothetical protein
MSQKIERNQSYKNKVQWFWDTYNPKCEFQMWAPLYIKIKIFWSSIFSPLKASALIVYIFQRRVKGYEFITTNCFLPSKIINVNIS